MNKNKILSKLSGLFEKVYQASLLENEDCCFIMVKDKNNVKKLAVINTENKKCRSRKSSNQEVLDSCFHGNDRIEIREGFIKVYPLTHQLADAMRTLFPHLSPSPIGISKAFGLGDRIGLATPGHIRAIRDYKVVPILAQQSIRELNKTGNTPEMVMDNALWGIIQEGYKGTSGVDTEPKSEIRNPSPCHSCESRNPYDYDFIYGADADHLKTEDDIKMMAKAGFTMFTIDPSDVVQNSKFKIQNSNFKKILNTYANKSFTISEPKAKRKVVLRFTEDDLREIVSQYYPAIQHIVKLYNLLESLSRNGIRDKLQQRKIIIPPHPPLVKGGYGICHSRENGNPFDFEVSIDETENPTTPLAHLFITLELQHYSVKFHSLAPKFIGEFQKAIDYIGDLKQFKENFKQHAMIAKRFGPYKISIHSGSDKFSAFPIIGEEAGELLHVKTSGTSYLSAIRIVARKDPALYREIHNFALKVFEKERKAYHVNMNLSNISPLKSLKDNQLETYLDANDSRQLLHITYGAVLHNPPYIPPLLKGDEGGFKGRVVHSSCVKRDATTVKGIKTTEDMWLSFKDRILDVLNKYEAEHYEEIEKNIEHHLKSLGF